MRTITAPGVEIKEIDKSQYSPAMVGTACYVMGFANKGEAYIPMEFTSRAAWTSYYGEPDTEAEKYFYNACTEVLNQNGRLYCARLPYDNASFEQMVTFTYDVKRSAPISSWYNGYDYTFSDITNVDDTIKNAAMISSRSEPSLTSMQAVDEWRTDETKVAANTFVIVDKTCAPYKMIQEDDRKCKDREILGIVPVVTTAANALYAQKLISVENRNVKWYESIGQCNTLLSGNAGIYAGNARSKNNDYNHDLVRQLNTTYKNYQIREMTLTDEYTTVYQIYNGINQCITLNNDSKYKMSKIDDVPEAVELNDWKTKINDELIPNISVIWKNDPMLSATFEDKHFDSLILPDNTTVEQLKTTTETLYAYYNTVADWHAADFDDALPETVSLEANDFFSSIATITDTDSDKIKFDRENLKKIGIVVYKTYIDPAEGNKIAFEPVEAFVGSLYKDDKDINTGITTFLDTIINTQSNYIYFFSNCFNSTATRDEYLGKAGNPIDIMLASATTSSGIMGFFSDQVEKYISVSKSIYDGMNKCFDKVSDINERDIDIIPDAGLANIASFIKSQGQNIDRLKYDLKALESDPDKNPNAKPIISYWKADSLNSAVKTWKAVEQKFDTFCKNVRKDCMFIADGLRPLVIQGEKKIVRPSKPANNIDTNILPNIKFITGLNTNYGAGYLDWFEVADEFSGDFFWCPPSIKAMGIYIYTDTNFNYWDAPAGLNRGVVAATDVAFSPTSKQAGAIYEKNWNYAINYPTDGIVLEGQKTFQVKPSAFDRVNVRRLFLRLERAAYKVARYFVYEGNTAYTRQRLVDALDPYFKAAKVGGGVYDYKIICDESINTPTVIDNNELKVKIGIKPTKTAEFILIDFIAVSTGGSFEEAMA